MIDPDVRQADQADADQLRLLEADARRSLIDQRGGQRWLDTHPERGDHWEASIDGARVYVAHIGEVLVGYLVATPRGEVLRIDEVFVLADARELGFGDAMLAAAVASGRRDGFRLLEGESLPGDRDTKNLYERAGIKARLITVSTEL
jgi:GNAT superfamily N-acetyltransferase